MRISRRYQPDVPVDTRSSIEAGIGDPAMVYTNGQDIVPGTVQVGSQVIQERGVAAGALPEKMSVQVDGGAVVYALEIDESLSFRQTAGIEVLAIPADAGGKVTGSGSVVGRQRPLHGPVVR